MEIILRFAFFFLFYGRNNFTSNILSRRQINVMEVTFLGILEEGIRSCQFSDLNHTYVLNVKESKTCYQVVDWCVSDTSDVSFFFLPFSLRGLPKTFRLTLHTKPPAISMEARKKTWGVYLRKTNIERSLVCLN